MATRFLLPLAVFGVGFGLGYGLTLLLVDDPEPPAAQASVTSPGAERDAPSALTSNPPRTARGADELLDEPATEASEDGDGAEVKATPDPAPGLDEPAADNPGDPDGDATLPWWDQCRGKRCTIDFGGLTGGLSVRRGTVRHGAVVDWDKDFASAKRLEVLPTDAPLAVQVVAVALDAQGRPAAAQIEWRRGGETLSGIIALAVGDKQVTLSP